MNLMSPIRTLLFSLVSFALLAAGANTVSAAEGDAKAKPKGRLPNYFAAVVSQEQRERVYEIQSRYKEQLDALMKQIEDLKVAREKEVDAVLTPDQLQKVNEKREAAKARRSRSSKSKESAEKSSS